jgi:hypothetical protein
METKELCLKLAAAETENEVITILQKAGYWDNQNAWRYYGDMENNYSQIGNQQSKPEAALVEKLVNSIDHILIKECRMRKLNPESEAAPQSISEATEKFFGIKNGILSNLRTPQRSSLAENIILVSTGSKQNPCYTIIDKGEGQTPKSMPTTFLSLSKSNKLKIPFVQGKYNMGGTGVLEFCGKNNLQLIISRRCPDIAKNENDETKEEWGVTIVRRQDPKGGIRSSVYTYLAPNGKILSFKDPALPLLPTEYPNKSGAYLEYGTFIKLYEYQMTGLKSNILFDLYNRLSILLPYVALPIRLYERREGYTGHSMETTLSGLSVRLDEDKRENLEDNFPSSCKITAMGQSMDCLMYAFKKGQAEKYRKNEGVLFVVNGQTHGYFEKWFFNKRDVGMGYLSDSIMVVIDCTGFDGRSRELLFMPSRDRLRDGDLKSEISDSLEEILRQHPGLRALREKRRREEVQSKLEDSKPLVDTLNELIKKSPSLAALFKIGNKLTNPFNLSTTTETQGRYIGKQYPTYFKLKNPKDGKRESPINRRARIFFETDVDNDYFERTQLSGSFILTHDGKELHNYTLNLWNGIATLNISLPENTSVGEELAFESKVTDETQLNPFINHFSVAVMQQHNDNKNGSGDRRQGPEGHGQKRQIPAGLALPEVIEIGKDRWSDTNLNFDENSALKIIDAGDGALDFYVNIDNINLNSEIKANPSIDAKLLQAKYKYALVLIGLALINQKNEQEEEIKEDQYAKIFKITRSLSPVILPMISYLGELEIEETSINN